MLLAVAVALLIVAVTAYLSLLESSVIGIDELKLVTILSRKPHNKEAVKAIFRRKREHLSSIVLLSTLVSISGSTYIGALAARELNDMGLAVFTALLAYCMLVFAKMLPKVRAVQVAEDVVIKRASLIRVIYRVTRPVLMLALFWVKLFPGKASEKQSSDELRSIIKHYNKRGVIGKSQRRMAEAALVANQRTLADLLVESGPLVSLPLNASVATIEDTLRNNPCKRYVVLDGNQPVGVVLYRHLARSLVSGRSDMTIGELVRRTISLPPDTPLSEAVSEFQEARVSVAILPGETPESTRFITVKQVYRALLGAA